MSDSGVILYNLWIVAVRGQENRTSLAPRPVFADWSVRAPERHPRCQRRPAGNRSARLVAARHHGAAVRDRELAVRVHGGPDPVGLVGAAGVGDERLLGVG